MTPETALLWDRISTFPLDAKGATTPFSVRLQKENRWSQEFTGRVIEEYRRFAFLSVVAGHMVSPSDAVDQAWHLHLFYTQNYWGQFCKDALGKPLHHNPSQGGASESNKYGDAYAQTLASYERFFGVTPPTDIWPTPETKGSKRHDYVRVDRVSHWVIPKIQWRRLLPYVTSGVIALALIGCAGQSNSFNPFDLDGPGFLEFFVCLMGACSVIALAVRYFFRPPGASDLASLQQLTPLEAAALAGNEKGCLNSTVAALVSCNYLKVHPWLKSIETISTDVEGLSPLATYIVQQCAMPGGRSLASLRSATALSLQAICERLVQQQLLLGQTERVRIAALTAVVAGAPLLLGIPRIIIGVSVGHPVEYLVILCLLTLALGIGFAITGPRRTIRGDGVLQQYRQTYAGLRTAASMNSSIQDATLGVALFGMAVLPVDVSGDMSKLLAPSPGTSNSSSSCGGSSCGGGGGGCGGGGCGG